MPDYSSLPSVTALASIPELAGYPESVRIEAAQSAIGSSREALKGGWAPDPIGLAKRIAWIITADSIKHVFNMTGVILHTGLGRAPLAQSRSVHRYENIEFDLRTGKRGDRQDHVRGLLCELTGAEDALVVNNAAAGVLVTLAALCKGKEVLLSRGESVEIGGSFRMPEIVKASGCKLVDVGTTNKTYAYDYANAITARTAAILRCHPSNYEIKGFTDSPFPSELGLVAKDNGVLFINDQGNGALIDFSRYGIHGIETLPSSVASGADISIASGDKLLGGPQCGLIVGRKDLIRKIAKHPIARAVRIDKLTLSVLEATLRLYRYKAIIDIPMFNILETRPEIVREICEALAPKGALVVETICELGSGAGSGKGVKSFAIVMKTSKPDKLLAALRKESYIGRIQDGAVWLDPICEIEFFGAVHPAAERATHDAFVHIRNIFTKCWNKWK